MRNCFATFLLLLLGNALHSAEPAIKREQIEKDLVLEMELKTPKKIRPGEFIDVSLVLRNRSDKNSYPVATPRLEVFEGRLVWSQFTATVQQGNEAPKTVAAAPNFKCGADFD